MISPRKLRTVGIIGGMGPAAGADFVRLFVQACIDRVQDKGETVCDQAFPEHWLVQAPVPDRTQALTSGGELDAAVFEALAEALCQLESVGVRAAAISCNTAHAWHEALQARFPHIELLHVAGEVATHLRALGVREVGLMATRGMYRIGLYEAAFEKTGIVCHLPEDAERDALMRGIYDGVKAGDMVYARRCFEDIAQRLTDRHGDIVLVFGCTEIPLAMPAPWPWKFVNPTQVLAQALADRAYA